MLQPEEIGDAQEHSYSDNQSEKESRFSNKPSDIESDDEQEDNGAYVFHASKDEITPQVNVLTRQGTLLSHGSTCVRHIRSSASPPTKKIIQGPIATGQVRTVS